MPVPAGVRVVALVLMVAVGVTAWATCASGGLSAAAEMACCTGADHHCGPAGQIDTCCGPETQDRPTILAAVLPLATTLPEAAAIPGEPLAVAGTDDLPRPAIEAFGRELLKIPREPTYLLTAALLI